MAGERRCIDLRRPLLALLLLLLSTALPVSLGGAGGSAILITAVDYPRTVHPTAVFNVTVHLAFGRLDAVYYDAKSFKLEARRGGNGSVTLTFSVSPNASAGYYLFVLHASYLSNSSHCEVYRYVDPESNQTKTVKKCFVENKHYEDTRAVTVAVIRAVLYADDVVLPYLHTRALAYLSPLNYSTRLFVEILGARSHGFRLDYAILTGKDIVVRDVQGRVPCFRSRYKVWADGKYELVHASTRQLYIVLRDGWRPSPPALVVADVGGGRRYGYHFRDGYYEYRGDVGGLVAVNASFVEEFWTGSTLGFGAVPPSVYTIQWNLTVYSDAGNYTETFYTNLTVAGVMPLNLTRRPGRWSLTTFSPSGSGGPVTLYVESPTAGVEYSRRLGVLQPSAKVVDGGNATRDTVGDLFVVSYKYPTSIGEWTAQYVLGAGRGGFLDLHASVAPGVLYVAVNGEADDVTITVSPPMSRPHTWLIGGLNGTRMLTAALPYNFTGTLNVTAYYTVNGTRMHKSVAVNASAIPRVEAPGGAGGLAVAVSLAVAMAGVGLLAASAAPAVASRAGEELRARMSALGSVLVERGMLLAALAYVLYGPLWRLAFSGAVSWIGWATGVPLPPVRDVYDLVLLVAGQIAAAHAMVALATTALTASYALASVLSTVKIKLDLFLASASVAPLAGLGVVADMLRAATVASVVVAVFVDPLALLTVYTLAYLYPAVMLAGFVLAAIPGAGRLGARLIVFTLLLPVLLPIPVIVYNLYTLHVAGAVSGVFAAAVAQQVARAASNPLMWVNIPVVIQNAVVASAAMALTLLTGFAILVLATGALALLAVWLAWSMV